MVLIVLALGGCANNASGDSKLKDNTSTIVTTDMKNYDITKTTYTEDTVKIFYPQISNLNDSAKQTKINNLIKTEALKALDDSPLINEKFTNLQLNYDITYKDSNLLSIKYNGFGDVKGMSKHFNLIYGTNIDINKEVCLSLSDIATINENLVEKYKKGNITRLSSADMKMKLEVDYILSASSDNLIKILKGENTKFYFTKDSLGIVTNPMAENMEFEISYEKLGDSIKNSNKIWTDLIKNNTSKNNTDGNLMKDFKVLTELIKKVDINISKYSKEDASKMISEIEDTQKKNITILQNKYSSNQGLQKKISAIYYSGFKKNDITKVSDKELKDLLNLTYENGYKLDSSEGTFFPVIDYVFYNKYINYLTPDLEDYISLMITESEQKPIVDGGLKITWKNVIDRALKQQEFINNYKNSTKLTAVKALLKTYLSFTLFGSDNTPLFDVTSKKIVPDAKKVFLKFSDNGNDSTYLKVFNKYMQLLQKNNYQLTNEVEDFRKDAIITTEF